MHIVPCQPDICLIELGKAPGRVHPRFGSGAPVPVACARPCIGRRLGGLVAGTEASHSGLVRPPAKRVEDKTSRGFKSRRLRAGTPNAPERARGHSAFFHGGGAMLGGAAGRGEERATTNATAPAASAPDRTANIGPSTVGDPQTVASRRFRRARSGRRSHSRRRRPRGSGGRCPSSTAAPRP